MTESESLESKSIVENVPLGFLSMVVVASVNAFIAVMAVVEGRDPFGYLNATILATMWAVVMALDL